MKISKELLISKAIDANMKGKIFTAIFTKKDGSERSMNCRGKVTSHLKGGELKYRPLSKGLLGTFDMKSGGYRMINLTTLKELHCDNEVFTLK